MRITTFLFTSFLGVVLTAGYAPVHAAGILAPTDQTLPPLRVTSHVVDATVNDQIALTTVRQTFRNDTSRRLEATYVFPLPENADLTEFHMSFNGKMVKGEVLPAEQARQVYESIVRQTRDPGLIEFIGRRLLQMRVFPIEPNSDTKIEVKYQQVCRPVSGMSGFHYPLRTTKAAGQVYGTVRFALTLHTNAPLKNIWSPTHAVEIVRDGEHVAKIAYEASQGSLNDDFMLLYDTDASDLGLSVIGYNPADFQPGHFVLTLTPKQLWEKSEYQPQDVVFVMDTSGSMAGEKLDQARSALKFCIDKLDERDRFSVVRFSTGFDVLFDSVAEATKEKRAEARTWIDQFTAAGGTNITDTLRQVLDMKPEKVDGRPYVVVFITDGMGNQPPEETMKMVKGHTKSSGARIFPFGVGHDVNTIMLDQLATNYSGRPTYVQPGENLELVLGDFFGVISQPVLTDLKIFLPEIDATERFPATLSDLYHGQQLILAGRFATSTSGPIKLTATRNGKQVEYSWPNVAFTHTAEATYVPAIWAGRKIAYLIDQIRLHGENTEMISEIIAISQEHGIQTPYTSWLVNPEMVLIPLVRLNAPASTPAAGRGGGGSLFGEPSDVPRQREVLRSAGVGGDDLLSDGATGFFAVGVEGELAASLDEASGKAATVIARRNAELREKRGRDGDRVDENVLASRRIDGRWYNRIGRYLVDESIAEETEIIVVRFGSEAYFELVRRRPDLRPALAAGTTVVVKISDSKAVLVSETKGLEQFSDEELEQIDLGVR